MTASEHWTILDIDAPDAGGLTAPAGGVHVLAFVAAPDVRADGWAPRAAVEISRGWSTGGSRIVLCDTGFEEPALHGAAGLDNLEGISDALLFGTSFQRVGQPLSRGLFLASAGTAVPDGEALRAHPRWRDFARGFVEAGAILILYVPSEAPGADALLSLCDAALVLGHRAEAGGIELPENVDLLGRMGPPPADTPVDSAGAAGGAGGAAGAPAAESMLDETSVAVPDGLRDEEPEVVSALESEGKTDGSSEPGAVSGPAGDTHVASDPDAMAAHPDGPPDDAEPQSPDPAKVPSPDPVESPSPDSPDGAEALPDTAETSPVSEPDMGAGVGATASGMESDGTNGKESRLDRGSGPAGRSHGPGPSRPRSVRSRLEDESDGSTGRTRTILIVLLLVIVAAVVAARAGIVRVPGLTPAPEAPEEEEAAGEGVAAAAEAPAESEPAPATDSVHGADTGSDEVSGDAGAEAAATPGAADPYFLALGSFEELDLALRRARVNRRTFPSVEFVVAPVEVNGRPWFRLLAGPAPDRSSLSAIRERLTGSPIPSGGSLDWIVRRADLAYLLAEFADLEAARAEVAALEERAIPVYLQAYSAPGGVTTYRIYAGVYSNAEEAGYMGRYLEENGVEGAVLTDRLGIRPQ